MSAGGQEFVVAAEFGDGSAVEHRDPVGPADGGEAVRDDDAGGAPGDLEEAVVEGRFGPDVQLCGGLVENQDAGAAFDGVQGAGQGEALPLAAGQVGAAGVVRGQDGAPAVRQAGDEFGGAGPSAARARASSSGGVPFGVRETFSAAVNG